MLDLKLEVYWELVLSYCHCHETKNLLFPKANNCGETSIENLEVYAVMIWIIDKLKLSDLSYLDKKNKIWNFKRFFSQIGLDFDRKKCAHRLL